MALGSAQPLREMSTRKIPEGKGRPARKAENFTVICERLSRNSIPSSPEYDSGALLLHQPSRYEF
jgi:hypothetical protein